jgi:hypothetical protein
MINSTPRHTPRTANMWNYILDSVALCGQRSIDTTNNEAIKTAARSAAINILLLMFTPIFGLLLFYIFDYIGSFVRSISEFFRRHFDLVQRGAKSRPHA